MRNIFIKLNLYTNDEIIYININHIISLAPRINCTLIAMPDSPHPDSLYRVKESAEDIIVMINKAQKKWL
jgi:hypothetical protein